MDPKYLLLWDDEHLSTSNLFPLWPGTNSAIMEELWDFMRSEIILLTAAYLICALEKLVKMVSVETIKKNSISIKFLIRLKSDGDEMKETVKAFKKT